MCLGYRFTMWIVFLAVGLSVAAGYHHSHYHDSGHFPSRNQRIIKLHSSSYKHHPHHKHVRPGPLGPHLHYHGDDNDYHYEYIRPNRPPPIPPFINNPPPHKYTSRPPVYSVYKSSFGGPYKSPNSFRPPVKEIFRPLPASTYPSIPHISKPSSTPTFDYIPSSSPSLSHVHSSDDNRGPIHEIPAPNLGPKPDKPIYGPPTEHPLVHYDKRPSYEVVESNDKVIEHSDGTKGYYAPDPDPSLPAPKIPPTTDPHSIPTPPKNNEVFPTGQEYQILEAGPNVHAPIPNLSSQELYDLMHSFPNDQYTVVQSSVIPQPMVTILGQQSYNPLLHSQPNSHQEIENNGILQSSVVNHQQYQDFNNPHYQSFNYEENNPNSAAVPVIDNHYEQDTSETDNSNSLTVIRNTEEGSTGEKKTESVKKTLPSDLSNLIIDEDFEKDNEQSPIFNMKNPPEVPFYVSLPSKEAAEALATLQAAGSVVSKVNKLRGDQGPEEWFGLPKKEVTKPQNALAGQIQVSDEVEEESERKGKKTETVTVDVQKSIPLYETSYAAKSLTTSVDPSEDEILASLDVGQGALSERFGKKIHPKQ